MKLQELVSKYIQNTERVFKEMKITQSSMPIDEEKIKNVIVTAKRYLEDATIRISNMSCLSISFSPHI